MIPRLDKANKADLNYRLRTLQGNNRLIIREPEPNPSKSCLNCRGAGKIWVQEISKLYDSPADYGSSTYHNNQWWRVVENIIYPCPICASDDRQYKYQYLWEMSGLDDHHKDWKVNYIKDKPGKERAYQAAISVLAESPRPTGFLLLYGSYGVGKSGVLRAMTAQLVAAGVEAHYTRAADILAKFRSSYNQGQSLTEQEISDLYAGYLFLAIDEVDVAADTPWAQSILRMIIDRRYELRQTRATMFGSNVETPNELWPYLKSRLDDGQSIFMGGGSLRGVK